MAQLMVSKIIPYGRHDYVISRLFEVNVMVKMSICIFRLNMPWVVLSKRRILKSGSAIVLPPLSPLENIIFMFYVCVVCVVLFCFYVYINQL